MIEQCSRYDSFINERLKQKSYLAPEGPILQKGSCFDSLLFIVIGQGKKLWFFAFLLIEKKKVLSYLKRFPLAFFRHYVTGNFSTKIPRRLGTMSALFEP